MRGSWNHILLAAMMLSISLAGCFSNEEIIVEETIEVVPFGAYSVVAPIDTGINVYHDRFQLNETYPDWLLEGLGVTMWCNLTQEGSWQERYRRAALQRPRRNESRTALGNHNGRERSYPASGQGRTC